MDRLLCTGAEVEDDPGKQRAVPASVKGRVKDFHLSS